MKRLIAAMTVLAGAQPTAVHASTTPAPSPTADQIRAIARAGDWILTRTHASIYDAAHDSVIEATSTGVRETPLAALLVRLDDDRVVVLRPSRMTIDDQREAVVRARTVIGPLANDDAGGGYLVYWASQTEAHNGAHETADVSPSALVKYGEVIYWSR
ncbi:MAG: hypothetical protein NT062_14580 [Proteobacteria bacterium]|nr:hypothetical protein [Pseudomonadota bacterium]